MADTIAKNVSINSHNKKLRYNIDCHILLSFTCDHY